MKKHVMVASSIILLGLAGLATGLAGCSEKGPAEKAGERVDEMVDNVQKGAPILKEKGPAEKVGNSIDDATR